MTSGTRDEKNATLRKPKSCHSRGCYTDSRHLPKHFCRPITAPTGRQQLPCRSITVGLKQLEIIQQRTWGVQLVHKLSKYQCDGICGNKAQREPIPLGLKDRLVPWWYQALPYMFFVQAGQSCWTNTRIGRWPTCLFFFGSTDTQQLIFLWENQNCCESRIPSWCSMKQ